MIFQPFKKPMVIHITGGNAENDGNQIVIFVGRKV